MNPESEQATISLIHCDDAISAMLAKTAEEGRFHLLQFPTALTFLEQFQPSIPGCVIADFDMPDRGGWELVDVVQAEPPGIQIVLLAGAMDAMTAVALMKAGVSDILLKPVRKTVLRDSAARAIEIDLRQKREYSAHSTVRGHFALLTPREREVFKLVVSGLPSRGIAQLMGRSQKTVEVHRTSIMKKMEARSVVDLVRMGMELRVLGGGVQSS